MRGQTGGTAGRTATLLAEVGILCLVAVGLVAAHRALPTGVRADLILSHRDPATLALWTTHFVHASRGHVLNNAVGFLLVAVPALAVARRTAHRQFFWTALSVGFVVLPVPLSVATIVWYRVVSPLTVGSSLGFSGFVGAGAGLLTTLLVVGWTRHAGGAATSVAVGGAVTVAAAGVGFAVPVDRLLLFGGLATVAAVGVGAGADSPRPRLVTLGVLTAGTAALAVTLRALLPGSLAGGLPPSTAVHGLGVVVGLSWSVGLLVALTALDDGRRVGELLAGPSTSRATTDDRPPESGVTVVRGYTALPARRRSSRPPVGRRPTPFTPHHPDRRLSRARPSRTPIISSNGDGVAYLRCMDRQGDARHRDGVYTTDNDPRHTTRAGRRSRRASPQYGTGAGRDRNAHRVHRHGSRGGDRGGRPDQHGRVPPVEVSTDRRGE
ncbi:hypothetical protein [Halobaculum sp. MBLA0143]|uniref:hypothetical protein n=1 Tax=Halobaculum sp. MBLA0143 TaxID=3079933 RepID=UPI0035241B3F